MSKKIDSTDGFCFNQLASGKVKAVVMLLEVGSKVNGTDLVRDTPLHLTLRADHAYDIAVQLMTILLQYGASPILLGLDDDMPLDIARRSGQTYCLDLLEMALGKKSMTTMSIIMVASFQLFSINSSFLLKIALTFLFYM